MVGDFVEIVDEAPLDITKYTDLVRSPAAGAIATFMGTTRDTFEDKEVVELRYEAYVPMAQRQLRAICTEARNRWELMRVAVAHRLGVVPVGEESVFVAVSSVHRRDALEACEYVIDEIKASVPIWKKEIYTNGEVWKENSEFLLRKPELSRQQAYSKPNKIGQHSRCCGHKERVSVNGDEIVGNSEKEPEGNGHFEGEANAERCIREEDCQGMSGCPWAGRETSQPYLAILGMAKCPCGVSYYSNTFQKHFEELNIFWDGWRISRLLCHTRNAIGDAEGSLRTRKACLWNT